MINIIFVTLSSNNANHKKSGVKYLRNIFQRNVSQILTRNKTQCFLNKKSITDV